MLPDSDSHPTLSAIICTHNPKLPVLERAVAGLKGQTLAHACYEFIIVDNGSHDAIPRGLVEWHPKGRLIREDRLGLTHARLRGIRESSGALIVFIDDDNVLDRDYLSGAIEIARSFQNIGAFGASIRAEFEVTPPPSIVPYVEYLACSEVPRDYWCNFDYKWSTPSGAGLCVRRSVAEQYLQSVENNPVRRALGRTGQRLTSGEDHDLAMTATDMGLGVGRFKRLQLTHIIARQRLTEDYIIRLYAGIGECTKVLEAIRPHLKRSGRSKLEVVRFWWQVFSGSAFQRRLLLARRKAERRAERALSSLRQ